MADSGEREEATVAVEEEDQLCEECLTGRPEDCNSNCDFITCLDHDINRAKKLITKFEAPLLLSFLVSGWYKDKVKEFLALQKEYQAKMEYYRDYYRALLMVEEYECKRPIHRQDGTFLSTCNDRIKKLKPEIACLRIEFTAKSDPLLEHLDPMEHIRVASARLSKDIEFHRRVEIFKLVGSLPLLGEGGI
jgi:hypothetical protein